MNAPIPPLFADPDPEPMPALAYFRRRPAQTIVPGYFVLLGGEVYRVRAVQTHSKTPRRTFTLAPHAGGRITSETYYNREWLLSSKG